MIKFDVKTLDTATPDQALRRYSINMNLSAASPKELVDQIALVAHTVQHYTDTEAGHDGAPQ